MTLRLILLISLILFLSLGAFGLLINASQDAVMAELTQTVSDVGQGLFRSFGSVTSSAPGTGGQPSPPGFRMLSAALLARIEEPGPGASREREVDLDPGSGHLPVREIFERMQEDPDGTIKTLEAAGYEVQHVNTEWGGAEAGFPRDVSHWASELPENEEPPEEAGLSGVARFQMFLVDQASFGVEQDPAEGLVVKLTGQRAQPLSGTLSAEVEINGIVSTVPPTPDGEVAVAVADPEVIRMAFSTRRYESIFSGIRQRMQLLFVLVFVVGSTLAALLVRRFLRPVRALHAGLHQLADGRLDATVTVQGGGELAHLGAAFNQMVGELRRHRDRATEVARNEKQSALGRLAAGVAHDVRNPLHSIGLTLQHLQETCRPESAPRSRSFDRLVQLIRGEVRRVDDLVSSFLRFARSDGNHACQSVQLPELLTETMQLVRQEAEQRGIEVCMHVEQDVPPVEAHPESLRAALLNLVLNAFEAMPEGGRVDLHCRREGDGILLAVNDNGPGIPPQEQDKVFEFAYSTKENGHGLGLAMVHHVIVGEHQGTVELDSELGRGTCVRLHLPVAGAGSVGREEGA